MIKIRFHGTLAPLQPILLNVPSEQSAKILKALAEPKRLEILQKVAAHAGAATCQDVLASMKISQPTFSHHVNELIEAGLLVGQQDGRCVHLSVNTETYAAFLKEMEKLV